MDLFMSSANRPRRLAAIGILAATVAIVPVVLCAAPARAGIEPSTSTRISGMHGKECTSTSPQYMINAGGAVLRTYPGHRLFTVLSAPSGTWIDPYITVGYNDSVPSTMCDAHALLNGKYADPGDDKLPARLGHIGRIKAGVRDYTPGDFRGDSGFDIWLTANPAHTSYDELARQGGSTTEVMIWLNHPGLSVQSPSLLYYPVTIDGKRWRVQIALASQGHRSASHPDGWNVVDFIAPKVANGYTTDIGLTLNGFLTYAISHGWLKPHDYLMSVNQGFEFTSGGAGAAVKGYSLTGINR
jgi:hypothetical protein